MAEIKHLRPDEVQDLKFQYPEGNIKEWQVVNEGLVIDYFDTEEEAREEADDWNARDLVEDALREAVHKIAEEVGIDVERVAKYAKEFF